MRGLRTIKVLEWILENIKKSVVGKPPLRCTKRNTCAVVLVRARCNLAIAPGKLSTYPGYFRISY